MLRLRYVLDGEDHVFPLSGSRVRLGRGSDNEIVLPDVSVSRYHAELSQEDGSWYVQDLKSTNGVEVNRAPVQRARLQPGDRLGIGIFDLQLEHFEPRDVRPAALPSKEDTGPILTNATIVRHLWRLLVCFREPVRTQDGVMSDGSEDSGGTNLAAAPAGPAPARRRS